MIPAPETLLGQLLIIGRQYVKSHRALKRLNVSVEVALGGDALFMNDDTAIKIVNDLSLSIE